VEVGGIDDGMEPMPSNYNSITLSGSQEEDEELMHVAEDCVQWRVLILRRWNFILPE
jgi:hypothetical protein